MRYFFYLAWATSALWWAITPKDWLLRLMVLFAVLMWTEWLWLWHTRNRR